MMWRQSMAWPIDKMKGRNITASRETGTTRSFLAVNNAAIQHYVYSRNEFLRMTIHDIRPEEDAKRLSDYLTNTNPEFNRAGEWRHKKKDGTIITVEITSNRLNFEGRRAV